MATRSIALRDRDSNVVAIAFISECDYDNVSKYSWCRARVGAKIYVAGLVNNKSTSLHKFLTGPTEKGFVIDHINGNGLDNTRPNLRKVTVRQNNQNCNGRHGSSEYHGVSWNTTQSRWVVSCCGTYLGSFKVEEDAAKAYDRGALAICGPGAKVNGLLSPDERDEVLANPGNHSGGVRKAARTLPEGVLKGKDEVTYLGQLYYKGQRFTVGRFQTPEEAKAAVDAKRRELVNAYLSAHYARSVLRNSEGVAIIPMTNRAKEVVLDALVDDDNWHALMLTSWSSHNGYVQGLVDGTIRTMHAVLVPDAACVDHMNHVRHDNRRTNLRGTDYSHNSQNRGRSMETKSRYIGVRKQGDFWIATITKDHNTDYLGTFLTDEDAARAYNRRAKELYDRPLLNPVGDAPDVPQPSAVLSGPGRAKSLKVSTSRYIGVNFKERKWVARVTVGVKRLFLGSFETENAAATAYNAAVLKYKLSARLNNVQ